MDQLIVTGGGSDFHQYVDRCFSIQVHIWAGWMDGWKLVDELHRYDLTGTSRDLTGFIGPLPDLLKGRGSHACGSFTDSNGDQVD